MKLALVKDGMVLNIVNIQEECEVVPLAADAKVNRFDLYDGKVFSANPDKAAMAAAEAKRNEIMRSIGATSSMQELKAAVLLANQGLAP